ncbi:MAG: cbb3-type cytochrome c oxidase subunit I, partial [Candidatus Acidiferrales bacterium]
MSAHASPIHHSEAPKGWIRHYMFSLDHKIIGTQYILLGLSAVTIGMILSLIVRLHLVWPNAHIWGFANGIVSPEDYLRVITMHGTLMVFFVLTTVPQSGFGNYFLPIQIGAPDMAFP